MFLDTSVFDRGNTNANWPSPSTELRLSVSRYVYAVTEMPSPAPVERTGLTNPNQDHPGQNHPGQDRPPGSELTPPSRIEVAVAGYRNDPETARLGLSSTDARVRSGALTALARASALETAMLLNGLTDPTPSVVRRAVELSSTESRGATAVDDSLLTHLRSDSQMLVEVAAFALGERHQEASASTLVDAVVAALSRVAVEHADPLAREAAVAALGSVGLPSGLAAVLSATTDKATVRRRAVLALAAFEGEEVNEALHRARTDRDWQVRQAAEDLTNPRI